jgi:septum site-determining protein MinD
MVRTIGIIAIKGGVGKTTISASLAADLVNHRGKRVLLVDANYGAPNLGLHMDIVEPVKTIHDVLRGKARAFGAIHNRYGVDVIPGSYVYDGKLNYLKLRDRLRPIAKNYDYVIIDSSPALNEEVLSTMMASDNLFVVTTPDYPTLSSTLRASRLAMQRGKPITGLIINKIRDPKHEINLKEIEESTEIPVVARIPDDKRNVGALFTRIPTSIYHRKTRFSKEIGKFALALTGGTEKRSMLGRVFGKGFRQEEVNRQILKDQFYRGQL